MPDATAHTFLSPVGDQLVSPASDWFPTLSATPALSLSLARFHVAHYQDALYAEHGIELTARMSRAVIKRRAEYLAGRLCARDALASLSIPGIPRDMQDSRCPQWPLSARGAITHSHGVAGAIVGRHEVWQGLGLDIEHWIAEDSAQQLQDAILSSEEKPLLDAHPTTFAQQLTLIFSAKESLYKALNPIVGRSFYFHDAAIISWGTDTLTLMLKLDLNAHHCAGDRFQVHTRTCDDRGMTLVALT